jgi:catechol 2,3-dioxygenase-like lactoylglutathione lyase family enzyme
MGVLSRSAPRERKPDKGVETIANQPTTRITGVSTIGIPVRDQRGALEFYTAKLGPEVRIDTAFGRERWIEVAPPGSPTTLALVRGPNQVRIGYDTQVRLATDDAEAEHADLQARGVDVDAMIVRYPVTMFTLPDPDGNRIVIVEQLKEV